jgi:hypothetical protein
VAGFFLFASFIGARIFTLDLFELSIMQPGKRTHLIYSDPTLGLAKPRFRHVLAPCQSREPK